MLNKSKGLFGYHYSSFAEQNKFISISKGCF